MLKHEKRLLEEDLERLLHVTEGCRDSMHEPDERGLTEAFLVGDMLDNAWLDGPTHSGEYYLGLYNQDKVEVTWFNLANLIALARMAKIKE